MDDGDSGGCSDGGRGLHWVDIVGLDRSERSISVMFWSRKFLMLLQQQQEVSDRLSMCFSLFCDVVVVGQL